MDSQYGVEITNKYDLFIGIDDVQDPFDVLNKSAKEMSNIKKKGKEKEKEDKKVDNTKNVKPTNVLQEKISNMTISRSDKNGDIYIINMCSFKI